MDASGTIDHLAQEEPRRRPGAGQILTVWPEPPRASMEIRPVTRRPHGGRRSARGRSAVDGLVQRLGAAEADLAVELDGGVVLGGDFEVGAAEAGLIEALEGLADQGAAE